MFFRRIAPAIFILALAIPCTAQTLTLTENDYKRAETLLGYNANPLVLHSPARPVWLPDDRFWYRLTTERGTEFVLVDPARRARMPAFDQPKLAAALSSAIGTNYEPFSLPFAQFTFEDGDRAISFDIGNRRWKCDTEGSKCASANRNGVADSVLSPDGKRAAFIRDFNLWVRDVVSGKETEHGRQQGGGVKRIGLIVLAQDAVSGQPVLEDVGFDLIGGGAPLRLLISVTTDRCQLRGPLGQPPSPRGTRRARRPSRGRPPSRPAPAKPSPPDCRRIRRDWRSRAS